MKKSMNTIGRMTAMLLAFIMIISMGQSSVYASGSGPQTFVFSGKNADDEQEADAVEAADGGETTEADAAQALTEQSVEASITAEPTLTGRLKAFGKNAMRFFSIGNADEPEIVLSGLLPEGAEVNAYPVSVEIPGQNVLVAYDISISVPVLDENGEATGEMTEWQPDESLSVSIKDVSLDNASDVEIYHMEDASAEPEMIDITTADNGVVSFDAESFSIYAIVETVLEKTISTPDGLDYKITVTYDSTSGLPEGVDLDVQVKDVEEYQEAVSEAFDTEDAYGIAVRAFDISIVTRNEDGTLSYYQPNDAVDVSIELIGQEKLNDPYLLHIGNDGQNDLITPEASETGDGVKLDFQAQGFSVYVVVDHEPKPEVTYHFIYGDEENQQFDIHVTEGEHLLEPAVPSDPKQGMFEAWFWDPEFTDRIDFSDTEHDPNLTASQGPRTINVYGKFDGKHYLTFMSLPMEDGSRRTFETVVLDPSETEFKMEDVNTYGAPVGYKFRGWSDKPLDPSDPYNDDLARTEYYNLNEKVENITGSMTFYPVVKKAYKVTFNADPLDQGGLVDGKRTKVMQVADDETWEEVYSEISTVACEGYTLSHWYEGDDATAVFDFDDETVSPNEHTLKAVWTPNDSVNVTIMYWKEDVTPELYSLIETRTVTDYAAGAEIDLSSLLAPSEGLMKGRFLSNDEDMKYFYLAEITSGNGTTDQGKLTGPESDKYSSTITVAGDGSTVINVWYDRMIVKLTFEDCYSVFVRLGESLEDVWPTQSNIRGFILDSANALYVYPSASAYVLGNVTAVDNKDIASNRGANDKVIQDESYYTDTKPTYQAEKTLRKIAGAMGNYAYHWYEDTSSPASTNSVVYSQNSNKQFSTAAASIITREVDGYYIDQSATSAPKNGTYYRNDNNGNYVWFNNSGTYQTTTQANAKVKKNNASVSVYSSYPGSTGAKQLGISGATYGSSRSPKYEFYVFYKARSYAINMFDGDTLLARNTNVKYKTPLGGTATADCWINIQNTPLTSYLEVDANGVATPEAEALARALYGRKAPPEYMQFIGWFIDRDFAATDKTFDPAGSTMPSADLNLYARWEPRIVKVTVDKGTTSGQKETPTTLDWTAAPGTQILEYDDPEFRAHENSLADYLAKDWMNPTWRNHVFLGWQVSTYDKASDTWSDYKAVSNWNDTVDVDTRLRGTWQDMTPFSVHYIVDNHEVKLDNATYLNGGSVILKGYDKTNNEGLVFHGWKVRYGDDTIHAPGDTLTINNADLYLIGQFQSGSVNPGEEPALYVYVVWEPAGTDSGYADWDDDPARTALHVRPEGFYLTPSDTDGEWKVFYQEIIYSEDTLNLPTENPVSVVDGEDEFQGWFSNPGLTRHFEDFGVVDVPRSTVIYAGFKKPLTVTYHTVDGGRVLSVQNYAWDGSDKLNPGTVGENYTVARGGQVFKLVKWTNYDVNNQVIDESLVPAGYEIYEKGQASRDKYVTEDMDLYPIMREGYTLYFNTAGGSYIAPEVYLTGEPTEAPVPPTKGTGGQYTFDNWYTDANYTTLFHWGDELTDDTTVYARFLGTDDYQDVTAVIWLQNEDGESYSYAGSAVVAHAGTDTEDQQQMVNTVFELSSSHRTTLEENGRPIRNIFEDLDEDISYYEYVVVPASETNVGTNESVMVTKGENVLNLYYARKRYTLTFNSVNGNNAGQVKGGSTYSFDVWLGRDVTNLWPRDDEVVPGDGNTAFNAWSANGNLLRYESEITSDLLTTLGNADCALTATYVSTVSATTQPTYINNVSTPDATYSVVIEHHLLDDAANPTSDKIISKNVEQVDWSTYLSTYRTKFAKDASDQYTVPAKEDIENAWALTDSKYTLLTPRTEASNSSLETSGYEYRHEFRPPGRPRSEAYFGRVVFETDNALGTPDNGFYFYDQLEVKTNWERVEDHNLYYNGVAHTGTVKFMYATNNGTSRYNYWNGRRYAHSLSSTNAGDYDDYALSNFTTFPANFSTVTGNASNGYATHSRQNDFVTEYRRNYTDYTGGTITIKFYYTTDNTVQTHTLTRSYGQTSDILGSDYVMGDQVSLASLGTPDPAGHTADIQAVIGSEYSDSATYIFTGWYTNAERTSKVPSTGLVMPDRNITVYAGWADEASFHGDEVTVTTDVNGVYTKFTRETGTPFGSFNIPTSVAEGAMNQNGHTGDTLIGWYRWNDPYKSIIPPTEPITQDETVMPLILRANESFKVIYDLNGGSQKADANPIPGTTRIGETAQYQTTQDYFPGATVTVAGVDGGRINMRPGYMQFYDWNTKADGTGDTYYPTDIVTIPPDGNIVLYAQYSPSMETHLIYALGDYTPVPEIPEADRTVIFYDYRDTSRGTKLYTNSTYSLGTENDGTDEPATLTFNGSTVELVRPGWTFKGWLDETLTEAYNNADEDGKAAMLLQNGDRIRVTAPEINENGDPVPNYLIAQWERDALPVEVYVCNIGEWKNPTERVDDGTAVYRLTDPAAAPAPLTPDAAFAGRYYTPAAPYADYVYAMAAVDNTVIDTLTYRAKEDGSGYAWTYMKAGASKPTELSKETPLKLYFSPQQGEVTVHYRIVERGVYETVSTDPTSPVDVNDITGKSVHDEHPVTIDNVTALNVDSYVVDPALHSDYELLGVFYGDSFDKSKEIPAEQRNLYYRNGQVRMGSADGIAIDSSDIYITYYNKNYALVEARYVAVDATGSTPAYTVLDGVKYVDVFKGNNHELTLDADADDYAAPEGYRTYDFGYGTLGTDEYGDSIVNEQPFPTGVTRLTADETNVTAHMGGTNSADLGLNDKLFILCYESPRIVHAYAFINGFNGLPVYEKKIEAKVTDTESLIAALASQFEMDDRFELDEVVKYDDVGGNWPAGSTEDVQTKNIKNTLQGIQIEGEGGAYTLFQPAADDPQALYFLFEEQERTIPVRFVARLEDGSYGVPADMESSWPADQELTLTYNGRPADLSGRELPTIDGYKAATRYFHGADAASLEEIKGANTISYDARGVTVGDPALNLKKTEAIYYEYYPEPRTAKVYFVEKAPDGHLLPMGEGGAALSAEITVDSTNGVALTNTALEAAAKALDSDFAIDSAEFAPAGVFLAEDGRGEVRQIKDGQAASGSLLRNILEGVAYETADAGTGETSQEVLDDRVIYAVYYGKIPVHAAFYIPNGNPELHDEILAEAQKSVLVGADEAEIAPPAIEGYVAIGVTYGAGVSTLHTTDYEELAQANPLYLTNSLENGLAVRTSANDSYGTMDSHEEIFYLYYPDPRKVNVYRIALTNDGKVINIGDYEEKTEPVTATDENGNDVESTITYRVTRPEIVELKENTPTTYTAANNASKTVDGKTYYLYYIAVGPELNEDSNEAGTGSVVATSLGDLIRVSDSSASFINSCNGANYSGSDHSGTMSAGQSAIYLVYSEEKLTSLTITKAWTDDTIADTDNNENDGWTEAAVTLGYNNKTYPVTLTEENNWTGTVEVPTAALTGQDAVALTVDGEALTRETGTPTEAAGLERYDAAFGEVTTTLAYSDTDTDPKHATVTLTNTRRTVTLTKEWVGTADSEKEDVEIQIYDGDPGTGTTIPADVNALLDDPVTLTSADAVTGNADQWQKTIAVPVKSAYYARELSIGTGSDQEDVTFNTATNKLDTDDFETEVVEHTATAGDNAITVTNTRKAVPLTITNNVTGSMGDLTKDFSFTMTVADTAAAAMTAANQDLADAETITISTSGTDCIVTFTLKGSTGNNTITINTPKGKAVTLVETDAEHYTTTVTSANGMTDTVTPPDEVPAGTVNGVNLNANEPQTMTFTIAMASLSADLTVQNELALVSPTGVHLTWAPYLLMLLLGILALAATRIRKRSQMGRF